MRVLIVEDDGALADGLQYHLEADGFDVNVARDGPSGWRLIESRAPELVLLDRMLPELDGASILRKMRAQGIGTPVLMITALGGVGDRVDGLDAGADDYLVKPFHTEELLARVRALLRRPAAIADVGKLECCGMALDEGRGLLHFGDKSCSLSKREVRLMAQFMRNPGQVLPRELLMSRVWGPDSPVEDGNLDNYIYFLRKRLKAIACGAKIATVHGLGYRLEDA